MSDSTNFGGTITGGIQDISALLPLLGTEQCEQHVGSALDRGFLYSSVTPISIFGTLGIVRASFNILVASFNVQSFRFFGARALSDGGFSLSGTVAPIIGIDRAHPEQFLAETKLETMLAEEHIDNLLNLTVSAGKDLVHWNIKLVFSTLFISLAGLLPYVSIIHDLGTAHPRDFFPLGFGFPILRIFGSAFCIIFAQFLIQIRILALLETSLLSIRSSRIAEEIASHKQGRTIHKQGRTIHAQIRKEMYIKDLETEIRDIYAHEKVDEASATIRSWTTRFLCLTLAAGCVSTIAGYVGCFFLIQHSASSTGTLVWLAVEVALSVLRVILWAANPAWDDPRGVVFKFQLSRDRPIITCKEPADDIILNGVEAPLTRSDTFLDEVVAYTGPLSSLHVQDAQLYYIFAACDDRADDKCLIIVVYSLNEPQQARMLIKRGNESEFDIYICSLFPVPGTPVINVRAEKETERDSHSLTANVDFMAKLGKHYDDIDARIKRSTQTEYLLCRTWGMQQLPPTEFDGRGQHLFTTGEKAYLAHRALEQRHREICRLFENWVDIQVRIYNPAIMDPTTGVDFFLQQCDAIEREFLQLECRRYFELTLLKYCEKWDNDVGRKHKEVVADILGCMTVKSTTNLIRKGRLEIRLTKELEFFLDQQAVTRRNNMRARIFSHWREESMTILDESTENQEIPQESYPKQFHNLIDSVNDELKPFWRREWSVQAFNNHIGKGRDDFKKEMALRLQWSGLDCERYHNSGTIINSYQIGANQLFDMIDTINGDLCSLLDDPELEAPADRSGCDISAFKRMLNRVSEQWKRAQGT